MKKLILGFTLIFASMASAQMPKKWHALKKLVEEEIQTIKYVKKLPASLSYRLFELYSERMALTREKETQEYISTKSKTKKKKAHYFRNSNKLFKQTQSYGKSLLKKRFPYKAEVHFTLALNERDFGNRKKAEGHFVSALGFAKKNYKVKHKIRVSLAEYYYNLKKYKKAEKLYNHILKNKSDEWQSKHHYNAAWVSFKNKKHDRAIELAKKAFTFSQDPRYIDLSHQVLSHIGIFYTLSGKTHEAVSFVLTNAKDAFPYLMRLVGLTENKSTFEKTEYVFQKSHAYALEKKNRSYTLELLVKQLDTYRNFKKYSHFYKTAMKIPTYLDLFKDKKELHIDIVTKIKSFVGFLQLKLAQNVKKGNYQYSKKSLGKIINFFDVLITIDSINTSEYFYFQGESLFSVGKFANAAKRYKSAIGFESEKKDFIKKSVFSLLGIVSQPEISKKNKMAYSIFAYNSYLSSWPVSDKSQEFYRDLFNIYISEKNIDLALEAHNRYVKAYPTDQKVQRNQLTAVLDFYIKTKKIEAIAHWIPALEKGHLGIKTQYAKKVTHILGQLLFNKYRGFEDRGDLDESLKGHQQIVAEGKYPQVLRAKSSLYLAKHYSRSGDFSDSYEWLATALGLFQKAELKKQLPVLEFVQDEYIGGMRNDLAFQIGQKVFAQYCKEKFKGKSNLLNKTILLGLSLKDYAQTEKLNNAKCTNGKQKKTLLLVIEDHLIRHGDKKAISKRRSHILGNKDYTHRLANRYLQQFWNALLYDEDTSEYVSQLKTLMQSNHVVNFHIKDHLSWPSFEKKWENRKLSFISEDEFEEEAFNKDLGQKFELLKKLNDEVAPFLKTGQYPLVVKSYALLANTYQEISNKIRDYAPTNRDADFVKSFQAQMRQVSVMLGKKANQHMAKIRKIDSHKLGFTISPQLKMFSRPKLRKFGYDHSFLGVSATSDRSVR